MKKFVKKLTAGLLAFAMTVSTYSAAFAAPENTGDTAANTDVITISEEAENTLEAAKALSSLNANYGSSESDQDSGAKAAIKDAIFNDYNSTTDLSRYGISAGEMDSLVAEILGEKNMTEAVDVTYDTDDEGNVTTTEVEMDPMVTLAAEELAENAQVYGLSEEQSQELLGMYSQYLQLYEANADVFGVQVPYNTTRDTNANPIGSLLDVAGVPADAAQAGYVGYDVLSGIIQLYILGTQFAVDEENGFKDEIIAGRNEALEAIKDADSDMQEYLILNDWLADNCQFNMAYIMEQMVEPEPAENQLYTYAYQCMYNMIYNQVYDGTYNALVDAYGEDQAKAIATSQADAYMVDVQEDGGSGEQQAASTAEAIVGMWGSNQVGVFVGKKAVCFGYATVYAYLVQCAHPEIYTEDGKDIDTASNWKSYTKLNYELDSNGDPVKDEKGDYKWSTKAAAIADYVKIIFDTEVTMFGQESGFGEAHYWNAVNLGGEWYYVDPCYVDIYIECMNRDRVETDGNLNHLYFMFSDDSCRDMYEDNYKEIRTLYEGIATDKTYEDAWVAFVKSQPYFVDDRIYYFYDSTDLLAIMDDYGNGGNSSRASDSGSVTDYEGLFTESEYKIVYHDNSSMKDTSDDFFTLIDFNNGQVYNPETEELEANDLIAALFEEHQAYVQEYPSISISCAYYDGKIYFSLSNCILSYEIKTGTVTKLIEYTEVSGKRDMTNGLGGLAFTMSSDPGDNGITVQNPPIADITIKRDGKMYVSVATNYAFISGKDFGQLTDYSSYGYKFAETNYNPAYNTYYNNDEANDNDEFMWSANIVGTIDMSHLAGGSHSYKPVDVPASCTEDGYSVNVCSNCGKIQEDTSTQASAQTLNADEDYEAQEGVAKLKINIEVSGGEGEETQTYTTLLTHDKEQDSDESYMFDEEQIKSRANSYLSESMIEATLDETEIPATDRTVAYGTVGTVTLKAIKNAASEPTKAVATLNITLAHGGEVVLRNIKMESEEGVVSGDPHIFTAEQIQKKVETTIEESLSTDYVKPDSSVYEDKSVAYGDTVAISIEIDKNADAKLLVELLAGDERLAADYITKKGIEGTDCSFSAGEIEEKANAILPEGYVLSEDNQFAEKKIKFGEEDTVQFNAEVKTGIATLTIVLVHGDEKLDIASSLTKEGPEGETYKFDAGQIEETAESILPDNYAISESYEFEDKTVTYGQTEKVAVPVDELKAATLNIEIYAGTGNDAEFLGSGAMSETGVAGGSHTFGATDIEAKATEIVEGLSGNYVLDTYEYENVVVDYGATKTLSLTASKEQATATLTIEIKDSKNADAEALKTDALTADGNKGEPHTFDKDDIQAKAEEMAKELNGYTLDAYEYVAKEVAYGATETLTLTATQKDQAQATLIVKVYNTPTVPADPEEDEEEDTTGLIVEVTDTTSGYAGKTKDYTAEDIEGLVKEEVEAKGYTLDEIPEGTTYTVTYGDTEPVVVKLTATAGEGHTYIKFNETYYTKDSNNNWQKGTSYVCIDCGHAFELDEDDETVEENLRSNDKVLTDDEVSNYAKTKVWTWSTDRTEASMYTVPTDLKSHMFDCVWENSALSSREVATVKGDCETGEFTATLKSGETKTETVEKGHHSYLNQEEKDDDGKVTQEAAVQWSWADDCSSATVTFLCDVCGKETSVTVKQGDENMAAGDEVAPTCTEAGYITYTATVTVDDVHYISSRDLETEPAAGHNYKDGVCTECGAEQGNPFVDVSEDDYYYDAVLWAYNNGITSGTDATHFSPGGSCSRAQVVTFLWRTMGEPEPETTKNPFVDVSEETYYYKAVLWAVEQGITTGTDKTHFAPGNSVTRSQFVTFLHRNEGEPKPESNENPFVDVSENEYYYDAVIWAYENGITTGTDETHFSPDKTCTRGQVVAFLYRTYGEEK